MRLFRTLLAGVLSFVSIGCGTTSVITSRTATSQTDGTCITTPSDTVTNSQFQLNIPQPDVTMYPGETASIGLTITSLDDGLHQVSVMASHLPSGLKVVPMVAQTGRSAQLVFQSSEMLAAECFSGVAGVFSATVPVTVMATSLTGQSSSQTLNVNVVLENPSFAPSKTDLPIVRLATADGSDVTSRDDYVAGTISLADASNTTNNFEQTMQIKGHGSSTWAMPKKPYNIKLDSKEGVLGMAKSKHWVLLANYDDKTMLRDALAFHISQLAQMEWTPNSKFVELYLNGNYEGVYQIAEKVEIDSNRLDIDELDDTDNSGTALTGGYLMEIDNYLDATFTFHTPQGLPIDSDDPDPPTTEQANYISSYVTTAENALYSKDFKAPATGWQAYFDKNAAVDWFIVQELMGNQDGDFWSSDYFYKKRNDPLLYMGPAWDFDISSGNVNYGEDTAIDPSKPWIRNTALWYIQLFNDPAFVDLVKARWQELRPQFGDIPTFLDNYAATLDQGQKNNYARWPTLAHKVWPNYVAYGTYQAEIDYLKSWMAERLTYMDKTYGQ